MMSDANLHRHLHLPLPHRDVPGGDQAMTKPIGGDTPEDWGAAVLNADDVSDGRDWLRSILGSYDEVTGDTLCSSGGPTTMNEYVCPDLYALCVRADAATTTAERDLARAAAMSGIIEPRRVRMEFTYEADPLMVVRYMNHDYLLQRLVVAIEPQDEPGENGLYVDIDAWGRRLTRSGQPDQRTGFDRIYVSPDKVQTFMDDAERRYRQVMVRP